MHFSAQKENGPNLSKQLVTVELNSIEQPVELTGILYERKLK